MLTQTLTTNTNSSVESWQGGDGTLFAVGAFSGGTVKLQASIDGLTNWFDCVDLATGIVGTLTVNGVLNFQVAACFLRANLAGAAVAGTAQVETATAAGTVTVGGIAVATITSPLINGGTPRAIPFEVAAGDTPTVWAAKARIAITDDGEVGKFYTTGGATTAIVLTTSAAIHAANVAGAAFNIELATGTATGTLGVASTAFVTIKIAAR
jgi:hypothetical protein